MKNNHFHKTKSLIKAVIVDDEFYARENLQSILQEYCKNIEIVGLAEDITQALQLIEKANPDLVFLDIKLSSETGFQLLELIKKRSFGVIFVTAYDNYAIKAIKFSAIDYLLKPINHIELENAVKKFSNKTEIEQKATQLELLIENLSKERAFNRLGISTDGQIEFLIVKDIVRLQGESNYTRIFLKGNHTLMVSKSLVEFEELLADLGFFRVHKTHLVNLSYVKAYKNTGESFLILSDDTIVPVSRRRKAALGEVLKD